MKVRQHGPTTRPSGRVQPWSVTTRAPLGRTLTQVAELYSPLSPTHDPDHPAMLAVNSALQQHTMVRAYAPARAQRQDSDITSNCAQPGPRNLPQQPYPQPTLGRNRFQQ